MLKLPRVGTLVLRGQLHLRVCSGPAACAVSQPGLWVKKYESRFDLRWNVESKHHLNLLESFGLVAMRIAFGVSSSIRRCHCVRVWQTCVEGVRVWSSQQCKGVWIVEWIKNACSACRLPKRNLFSPVVPSGRPCIHWCEDSIVTQCRAGASADVERRSSGNRQDEQIDRIRNLSHRHSKWMWHVLTTCVDRVIQYVQAIPSLVAIFIQIWPGASSHTSSKGCVHLHIVFLVQLQSTCGAQSPFGILVDPGNVAVTPATNVPGGTKCFSLPDPLGRCHNTFNGLTQTMWLMCLKPNICQKLDEILDRRFFPFPHFYAVHWVYVLLLLYVFSKPSRNHLALIECCTPRQPYGPHLDPWPSLLRYG